MVNVVCNVQKSTGESTFLEHLKDVRGWVFDHCVNIHNAYLSFKYYLKHFSSAQDGFVLLLVPVALFLSFLLWWRIICCVNSTFPLFLFLISDILFILVSHILDHHPFSSFPCLFSLSLSAECLIPELGSSQQITALISLIINQYVTGSLRRLLANTGIWSAVRGGTEEVRQESRQGVRKERER